ncbi:MAG TPA: preprotein translocase subunit SecE [Candidatus Paceibacterota bacterium]|nr:preprotein translocase subunit SecE [Candidatus Paceibacterota bacterium]
MSHFINYLKDTVAELRHVTWPTNRQSVVYTALVIAISAVVAFYIGFFDFVFERAVNWLIR